MAAGWIVDGMAVLAAAALCGAWVAVQAWVARRDPCQPGVEGNCGCKGWRGEEGGHGDGGGSCRRRGDGSEDGPGARLVPFPERR